MIKRFMGLLLLLPLILVGVENMPINIFELPNGLKVIFCPVKNVDATAICLYYLNGSRNDPPDLPGVSLFFQDLMFGGTENLDPFDHVLFVNQKGGQIGGRVNYDNTFFYQVVPANDLGMAIRYESERIRTLKIDNVAVEALKRQILSRINRQEAGVVSRARHWVMKTILAGTAYESPVYGDAEKILRITPDRVRDFYKNYQNLSNLILLVCGKMDVDDLKNNVNNYFQDIPGGYRSRSVFAAAAVKERMATTKNWAVEGVVRPFIIYAFPAPPRLSGDYFYFDFLKYYLVGENISRLDYVFNQVNALGINVNSQITDYFEANVFLIEISAPDKMSLEKAKYLFDTELRSLVKLPISAADIRMVKNAMEIDFFKQMQALEARAQKIAEFYHMFGGLDFFPSYVNRIRRIDTYDIVNMARKYMQKDTQVTLNVYGKK